MAFQMIGRMRRRLIALLVRLRDGAHRARASVFALGRGISTGTVTAFRSVRHHANAWLLRHSRRYQQHVFNRALIRHARERDPKANATTAPPPDELIAFRAVWIAEAFTLSMMPRLIRALERLRQRDRTGF